MSKPLVVSIPHSLGREDLPIAAMLLKQAWQHILEIEAARSTDDVEQD